MEIKNSAVDLAVRPQIGSQKADGKQQIDELGGFKTMLKNKDQNKEEKTQEKEKNSDSEAAGNAAAVILGCIPNAEVTLFAQPQEALTENQTLPGLETTVLPEETKDLQTAEQLQTMGQFQTMDQFRFRQLASKAVEPEQTASQAVGAVGEAKPEQKELKVTVPTEEEPLSTMSQKPKQQTDALFQTENLPKQQEEALEPVREENRPVGQMAKMPEEQEPQKESAKALQNVSGEEKKTLNEKEDKNSQESLGLFQEKPQVSQTVQHIRNSKTETVYATVKADSRQELETGLSERLLNQIQTGKKELEVQLEPANLGKIRIKVSYEEGQVSVSVLCTESKTLKLLSQSAGDLGSILESNLERPVQILVDKQEADYLNNQQEQNSGQNQQEQHNQKQQAESSEDFVQKLRLGILGTDSQEGSYTDYRL